MKRIIRFTSVLVASLLVTACGESEQSTFAPDQGSDVVTVALERGLELGGASFVIETAREFEPTSVDPSDELFVEQDGNTYSVAVLSLDALGTDVLRWTLPRGASASDYTVRLVEAVRTDNSRLEQGSLPEVLLR